MFNEEIVGNDIDYNWVLDSEGDLQLVRGSENLGQAIFLRLSAFIGSLDWCYNNYGSEVKEWLGKNQNVYTRNTLVAEITRRVTLDPRIDETNVEIVDWTNNSIGIKIIANVKDGTTFQEFFIFSDLPRRDDNVNSPQWHNTWIDTREDGYYAKPGELVTVTCKVRYTDNTVKDNSVDKIVPIGEVSLYIGGYHVDIEQNPQEIGQSYAKDPGTCIFTFRVPPFIKKGVHDLVFKYKGIRGYNSCVGSTQIHVVERIPTVMEFQYPLKHVPWYYANPVDTFTEPKVHIIDANDYDVEHGEVRYYLSDHYDEDTLIFIEFPIIFHNSVMIPNRVRMYCNARVLDYTEKYVFRVNYMFRPHDIFELVGANGEHIDYLECLYENAKKTGNGKSDDIIFYLVSTKHTKPYEFVDEENVRVDDDRNDDIDVQRYDNSNITMRVVE